MKKNRGDYVRKYWLVLFFQFCFQKNHCFIEKSNPSEKNAIVQEELDYIDINNIGNLEHSPRLVFIDEESGNLNPCTQSQKPVKKVFLNILKNSQENTCVRVSFLIKF